MDRAGRHARGRGACSIASASRRPRTRSCKTRNETLSAEVDDLKHGDEAVEERARSELGLLKPGETFYQVVEPTDAAPKPTDDGGH